jgi:hypothetical protein
MTAAVHLSDSVQALIDTRLDTIDRILLRRVPRQDRLAIVREVESQIFELLGERGADAINREDVLAVLARLDPPEAYLADESETARVSGGTPIPTRAPSVKRRTDAWAGRASGMIGISALVMLLFFPIGYLLAASLNSENLAVLLLGAINAIMFICGVVGVTLGIYARRTGAWAVLGLASSVLGLLFSVAIPTIFFLVLAT